MAGPSTMTKTKIKTSTKVGMALVGLGAIAAGMLVFLPTTKLVCQDSDRGNVPAVKGTTQLQDLSHITVASSTDYCIDGTSLKEYYCKADGASITSDIVPCPSGSECSDGACVASTPGVPKATTTPALPKAT